MFRNYEDYKNNKASEMDIRVSEDSNSDMQNVIFALNSNKIKIDNNVISGETYKIKDSLKSIFGAKWDSTNKSWIITDDSQITYIMGIISKNKKGEKK